jgi:oligopeptide transport system permease protein
MFELIWRRFKRNPQALAGCALLSLILLFAIFGPLLSPYTYYDTHLAQKNLPPSFQHWFGTDDLGRDLFIRVWYGARISIFVGIAAALIDLVIGVLWGSAAALSGGFIDECMMRFADLLYSLPTLLVVIMLMVVLGQGLIPILIALTVLGWITMARIVRAQIIQIKRMDYIQAAHALGASSSRILFYHILPNTIGPIIVTMTFTVPGAIFTEAFLSFLGLGIQAPIASWGTMANEGLPALPYYPWRLLFPAVLISLTMLAFNLIGDGLRDATDPRECFV